MAKLTKKDKECLLKIGYLREDLKQIEDAKYKYHLDYEKEISEQEAIEKLGRECWLSGIGRACYHASSVRQCKRGNHTIDIDSDTFGK